MDAEPPASTVRAEDDAPTDAAEQTARARRAEVRSLPDARSRQAEVTSRLVESARDLVWDAGGPTFTVTQVVAAAGTSLKSFYRCFAGKDELLVALFEDDARRGADALTSMVDVEAEPLERLRVVVVGLFRFLTVEGRLPYAAALVREHLRLAESHPDQLRGVLDPFVAVFEDAVAAAQASRGGARRRRPARRPHLVPSGAVAPPRPHLPPDRGASRPRSPRSCGPSARAALRP